MTKEQRQELIALVEKGAEAKVGYYHSACVIRKLSATNGEITADMWGFALIGKFGTPAIALERFQELEKSLPESNPGCFRMCNAVAQLLDYDWKDLVEIHYADDSHTSCLEDHVASFKRVVALENPQKWAQSTLTDAFTQYEADLAGMLAV